MIPCSKTKYAVATWCICFAYICSLFFIKAKARGSHPRACDFEPVSPAKGDMGNKDRSCRPVRLKDDAEPVVASGVAHAIPGQHAVEANAGLRIVEDRLRAFRITDNFSYVKNAAPSQHGAARRYRVSPRAHSTARAAAVTYHSVTPVSGFVA